MRSGDIREVGCEDVCVKAIKACFSFVRLNELQCFLLFDPQLMRRP